MLGTAAWHASLRVPVVAPGDTVAGALTAMRGRDYDSAAVIAVCTGDILVGLVTIERLLATPGDDLIGSIMDNDPPRVAPGTHQEHAAWRAVQHGETGLAVVEPDGRFRGLIPPQRLLKVLLEEHDEDLARLGGFLRTTASARAASQESVPRRLWHRLPWLAVGLAGALLSAALLANFEERLSANVAIAYFIPGIVYLADAVGTQTETVAIRGLSVGVGIGRIAAREAWTGLLVGSLLAAVMLPIITVASGDAAIAAAVAIAVLAASAIATLLSIVIYLGAVSLLLP
jgi:magnesium transporter